MIDKGMTIADIKQNIYWEDKHIAAVTVGCSFDYVEKIMKGQRDTKSATAQAILTELERLATINIIANGEKNRQMVEIGRILFREPTTLPINPQATITKGLERQLRSAKAIRNQMQQAI
jgi:hypothetical protein